MTKEQIFKMIDGRINTMQGLAFECIELIYNAGYNEAIEAAAKCIFGKAPAFPRKDYGGPAMDAERFRVLTLCEEEIRKLKK